MCVAEVINIVVINKSWMAKVKGVHVWVVESKAVIKTTLFVKTYHILLVESVKGGFK